MLDIRQFALNLIQRNPKIADNPQAQGYLEVIQNNDSQKGRQIAENICKSYGMTKEEALNRAKQFFGLL